MKKLSEANHKWKQQQSETSEHIGQTDVNILLWYTGHLHGRQKLKRTMISRST